MYATDILSGSVRPSMAMILLGLLRIVCGQPATKKVHSLRKYPPEAQRHPPRGSSYLGEGALDGVARNDHAVLLVGTPGLEELAR